MGKILELYCKSLTQYNRYLTREVFIGDLPLGGNNPIRIQSMTTTDTMNTKATVEQTIRMVNSGCEYVRITAPSIKEAENLSEIKKELRRQGYSVPLIADIHFTPNAAELAARIVEKVRINPGNYADKKRFQKIDYTEAEYSSELERIRDRFIPLVKICKEYGTAMRIGTNHGSLSDRIMSRYGDTPLGMVESALEFVRICEDLDYQNIVLSMKASNPQVMVQAYRLLVQKMQKEEMNYPLHLGVTEAGNGEDARIKSAAGIGTLLEDGLGDTIRVSLTEDPEFEAPVALKLVERYKGRKSNNSLIPEVDIKEDSLEIFDPYCYHKRSTFEVASIGGSNLPRVFSDFSLNGINSKGELEAIGYKYDYELDKWNITDQASDFIYLGDKESEIELPGALSVVYDYGKWKDKKAALRAYPLFSSPSEFSLSHLKSDIANFITLRIEDLEVRLDELKNCNEKELSTVVFVIQASTTRAMVEQRRIFLELKRKTFLNPAVIKMSYNDLDQGEKFILYSATDFGALLLDGFGDAVWVINLKSNQSEEEAFEDKKLTNRILFGILQAARLRISKTEYIACPSCGRTLFDLQEVTARIRRKTEHLKGVKIGIMGCIVNGPGEMADADYGYVGSGIGKITLYRGKEIVRRNISSEEAVEALIDLIKEDNNWVDPD
ncbi:MAG: (E)-4-hydroxy-3-methylbut-2-enyl-diphosphate synthase [Bacteroidota bacterium]|nr:(E)-4-hydroxy-3-methylbut-2-enyl-diphosphate synthase [Bacteroidota bacterium]MDP4194453.1 (E)-4-hydroxy-3-methylbut-2-enyl-diphosphate synthase [Bacteroidota bacterium]